MKTTIAFSETVVGSLCKEIDYIKFRSQNISNSLLSCKDKFLMKRLLEEKRKLNIRIKELKCISIRLKEDSKSSLSSLFFHELCHRLI